MRIGHCNNVLVVAVIIGWCVLDAYCEDFSNIFKNCIKNADGQPSQAAQQYDTCFSHTPFKSGQSCQARDFSKCMMDLAADDTFQKCIGSTNLETLKAVAKIFSAQLEFMCSDAGQSASQKFGASKGPECSMQHRNEVLQCYSDAKHPIAGEGIQEVEMLSGFAFDEEYCRILSKFNKCQMTAIADCHQDVRQYTETNQEVRWNASPCKSYSNSGSYGQVPSMLMSAIAVLYTSVKLFSMLT